MYTILFILYNFICDYCVYIFSLVTTVFTLYIFTLDYYGYTIKYS